MEAPKNNRPKWVTPSISESIRDLWQGIKSWFVAFIDLKEGMDREGTIISINTGKMMRGSNAWMLICSIMIASLGLDLNSEAVIIGAMLISPLMSPILGIGLGVSINDRATLFMAIKHFLISILIALVTSILYFRLTPLGTFTDMIEARTAPTFLDGLVAIFGGLAGIISITRKDKSNAIPGVAIATALMPPLCVTGYGIANGNMEIALNSFYLFFLNSFFIALTSYLIIRLLDFPYKEHLDAGEAWRTRVAIMVFSLIIIIPGTFILRGVIRDLADKQSIKTFVQDQFGTDCINYKVFPIAPDSRLPDSSPAKDSSLLVVQLINRDVSDSMMQVYNLLLRDSYALEHISFQAIPDYRIQLSEMKKNAVNQQGMTQLSNQLNELHKAQRQNNFLDSLRRASLSASVGLDSLQFARMTAIIHQAQQFASLDSLAFGKTRITDFKTPSQQIPLFLAHWSNAPTPRTRRQQEAELSAFLKNYFQTYAIQLDTFIVHSY
ncbi:MAG: hypothetical protein DA408_10850 [Bacteroidetes bacterium]|nr:MAG: hypothetical protein C7N36_16720 [Bacteroidota bacterium]PTM12353.1 MAG: hypothetical protein DA408_10850 [Bacteroidota bacterium]